MNQRYVSNELTHFVGRAQPTRDAQFRLLCDIIRDGKLKACYTGPGIIAGVQAHTIHQPGTFGWGADGELTDGTAVSNSMVCFCDIPVADLGMHMEKYSQFGLAFQKPFLLTQGVSPVFYVAKTAVVGNDDTLGHVLDQAFRDWASLQLTFIKILRDNHQAFMSMSCISTRMFSYVQGFDPSLPVEHKNNTYMEREWRTNNDVTFNLDDVFRIVLPQHYSQGFRDEFPSYIGQVSFV